MKMTYIFIGIILAAGLFFYFTSCKNKSTSAGEIPSPNEETAKVKETKIKENPYPKLRNQSLSITADQLKLKFDDKPIVYGAIMDWDIGDAVITVVAFQTGDASLYISTGQVFIGGYAHDNIKKAGVAFVRETQNFLSKAKPTETTSLPDKECVRFYFLTNKGKFFYQETVAKIESKNSEWTRLFNLGNNVINEYRTTTENK